MPPPHGDNVRLFRFGAVCAPHHRAVILRHSFEPPDNARLAHLCGALDQHLRAVESAFGVRLSHRHEAFRLDGERAAVQGALALLQDLYAKATKPIDAEALHLALLQARATASPEPVSAAADAPVVLHTRRSDLAARTPNQLQYLRHMLSHDISFGIGPAGTGKTFLAVACAVDALERSSVQRIVLTRPAVEAGEKLGFLPGDMAQKVDPYLRPLYDALYDLMGFEKTGKLFERSTIEIAPLAYMRGRTLNHSFIILDEAQNTTPEQMKMFLTRIGFGTKAVITGDVTQIDLARGQKSGLIEADRILNGVRGIAFTRFTAADVVRHPLVQKIIGAYERDAEAKRAAGEPER